MEVEKRKNTPFIITIIILTILIILLGGYIGYDKFLNKNNTNPENTEKVEENNYVKTRTCTGIYRGIAALTQDFVTGEYGKGTLAIELKADGTYKLTKENISSSTGEYTIIDNTLLLKTEPEICGPDDNCSAQYSEYLNISEDCSNISQGYGAAFFDSDFILYKQN